MQEAIQVLARLRKELIWLNLDYSNLVAAARATIDAHHEGEEDFLYYIRDELTEQGKYRHPYGGDTR